MHAHILDQSGDWERETLVAFQSTHLVSFFKNVPMYVRVRVCNAYVCECQRTTLGVINSGHLL